MEPAASIYLHLAMALVLLKVQKLLSSGATYQASPSPELSETKALASEVRSVLPRLQITLPETKLSEIFKERTVQHRR